MTTLQLAEYLQKEIDRLGWSQAELADRAKLDPGIISRALNGSRMPSVESLIAIANAIGIRPERVMIGAGIFPPDPSQNPDVLTEKIIHLVSQMDDLDKNDVLQYAEVVLNRSKERDLVSDFVRRINSLPREEAKEVMKRLLEDLRIIRDREGNSR